MDTEYDVKVVLRINGLKASTPEGAALIAKAMVRRAEVDLPDECTVRFIETRGPSPFKAKVVVTFDKAVPDHFPVKVLAPGDEAKDRVTCGTCHRSWDDAIVTSMTPVPSARCPFEYYH